MSGFGAGGTTPGAGGTLANAGGSFSGGNAGASAGGTAGTGGASLDAGGMGGSRPRDAGAGEDAAADASATDGGGGHPEASLDGSMTTFDAASDSGVLPVDSGSAPEAGSGLPDTSVGPDAPSPESGSHVDASVTDAGAAGADAVAPDAGTDAGSDYINLAPPMLDPLSPDDGTVLDPPGPPGWTWFPIDGTQCRDGSPAGMFVRFTTSDKLFIYFEGGGACTNAGFCNFNPVNVESAILGTGETVIGSALGAGAARQQPGVYEGGVLRGIFDESNSANPFQGWNAVYIPYCTGDVHFGSKANAAVPGLAAPQQFVGYLNTQRFVGHVVPTFKDSVDYVIVSGGSAGAFGAALNYSMIQDSFEDVPVDVLMDSGIPFTDTYMPVCMQERWRELWGLDAGLPPDCTECFNADGGGLLNLADFLIDKHPNTRIALVSGIHDEVIRLFYSMGLADCVNIDTVDPVGITLLQGFPNVYYQAAPYEAGMLELRSIYAGTGRLSTYLMGGLNANLHQHTFRARFYDPAAGPKTIADFVSDFIGGQVEQIGP